MRSGSHAAALRIAIAVVSVGVVGGALAGCSRLADQQQPQRPAAVTSSTAQTPAPTSTPGASDSSLSSIQTDLNSATSSTANADGDVAAGDAAAATNDNS